MSTPTLSAGQQRLTQMSENAQRVFIERYCLPGETVEDAIRRVAKHIGKAFPEWEDKFFEHIATYTGVPNSPTFTGAGTPLAQLSACFTLDIQDSIESIMKTLYDAVLIQKSGGGLGFNFSAIRPKGALIKSTNKSSQGVCSWIKMYDGVFANILQACFSENTTIYTSSGDIKVKDLVHEMKAGKTFYAVTHKGFRKITAAFVNGVQPLYRVTTTTGETVETTLSHKYVVPDVENFNFYDPPHTLKPLSELQVGSVICTYKPDTQFKFVQIKSIEYIGDGETYDFEVEDVHLLIANGVYTSNSRRGANMALLRCDHPDIFDFIYLKDSEQAVTNFNISIIFTRDFMQALEANEKIDLWWENSDGERIVQERIYAKDIWTAFITHTWEYSEPSAMYEDNMNINNPLENVYGRYSVTNPCVTGDARVLTPTGEVTIKELVNSKEKQFISVDPRFEKGDYALATNVFYTGKKPVYLLTTLTGKTLKLTEDHQLKTLRGWVTLNNLLDTDILFTIDVKNDTLKPTYDSMFTKEYIGEEDVYDLTEPSTHSFIANGIVVHNCAEIIMRPYESCNLSCIAVDNFADWTGQFDWTTFRDAIRTNTYLLNAIVDTNELPVEEIREMNRKYRRIGNGLTGIHDAMIKLGIKYGTKQGDEFIEKLSAYLTFYGFAASNEIAREFDLCFDDFDRSIFANGLQNYKVDFSKYIDPDEVALLSSEIRKYGLANTHVSMIAPTGTRSTVADKGGYGIEPIFAYSYTRWVMENNATGHRYAIRVVPNVFLEYLERYKGKELVDTILDAIEQNQGTVQGLDQYFTKDEQELLTDANSLTGSQHINALASAQKYIQQGISKTSNIPHNTSIEEVSDLFVEAWKKGIKGFTIYRTGAREKVVIEVTPVQYQDTHIEESGDSNDIGLVCDPKSGVCEVCA